MMTGRRRSALVLVVVALGLAGCTGSRHTPAQPAAVPTTAVGPLLGTFRIGQRASLANGDTVQVYAYSADVTPSNPFSKPPPGSTFAVVDAEACAGPSQAADGLLNPFYFHLEIPGADAIPAGIPVKDPPLGATGLAPGACSRGFVTFEVPSGKTPTTVVYGTPATSIRWTIP